MHGLSRNARGISLVEALVALAIMGFGTLAVLGVQTTLRYNADISKQRGEAVRIAQQALEDIRSFETLDDYNNKVSTAPVDVAGYEVANTTYRLTQTITDGAADDVNAPRSKTIVIDVSWQDRSDQTQSVRLNAVLQGTPPVLAGSLVVNSNIAVVRRPMGRNPVIPLEATTSGDGQTSRFDPPGAGFSWIFSNSTGYITQVCVADVCSALNARLLAGYVRFTGNAAVASSAADAEIPTGAGFPLEVIVRQTAPADQIGDKPCYERVGASHVAYFCAVPVGTGDRWSGRSLVVHANIVATLADATLNRWRVCRYTPKLGHFVVPTQMRNEEHPLDYVDVRASLINQNFLMIGAGNGVTAFTCPNESDGTGVLDFVDGDTYRHQPAN
jgi:Tfp pilus assembly protein PilV